jgi:2-methylcitrate dehydratase PrpD
MKHTEAYATRSQEPTVAQKLARWATSARLDHAVEGQRAAKEAIADVIVCMIAGARDEGPRRVRHALGIWGAGSASVVGSNATAAPAAAALVNGMSAHALDFDDAFQQGVNHTSAAFVPALLALGEERGATGADMIDAYIVGVEVCSGLARGVMRSHYDIGWHTTSTIGGIAAAAACGRLIGLNEQQMAHALSLAVSMAGGCKVQFGTMGKPLHAGLAAQHGLTAALLGAAGVEARLSAIEGPMGFLDLLGGPSPTGWGENLDTLGEPLAIESRGLLLKRFPCCSSTHRTLDNLLDLRREANFAADDVVSIDTWVGFGNARNLMYNAPITEFEARFSMHYCVAVALLFGTVKLSDFTPAAIWRPQVRSLFELTTMHAYEAKEELRNTDLMRPHLVEVKLRDGRVLTRSRAMPVGSKGEPLSAKDHRDKFEDCCRGALSDQHCSELTAALGSLETVSLRKLGELLRFDAGAPRERPASAPLAASAQ